MGRQPTDGAAVREASARDRASGAIARSWWVPVVAAIVAAAAALVLLFVQVEVSDDSLAVTRNCGSAFDVALDRSGWQAWWASDLDEADAAVRAALVRTERCPTAVNRRLGAAGILGAASALLVVWAVARRRTSKGRQVPSGSPARLVRLGRITTWLGAALTGAGVVAVVVLVADADSTLFLYTDRFVVGVVGLIVLVPTIALIVIGRAIELTGSELTSAEPVDVASSDVAPARSEPADREPDDV